MKKDIRPMNIEGLPAWVEKFSSEINSIIVAWQHRTKDQKFWNKRVAPHLRNMFSIADTEIYSERRRTAHEIAVMVIELQKRLNDDMQVDGDLALDNVKKHIIKKYRLAPNAFKKLSTPKS